MPAFWWHKESVEELKEGMKTRQNFSAKKFEQMEERVEKLLENKVLRAELEKCQNKQQQTIDDLTEKLKVSIEQLSLKHQGELEKLSNAHKKLIEEIKEQREMDVAKNDKLEKYQKEEQLNVVHLQKTVAVLREIDTANLFVSFAADLFPCVSLGKPGTKIEANFGPNFQSKFAEIEQKNALQQEKLVKLEQYQKEQQQRRRPLPLELKCEVISALPFQHGRRMLLLSRSIAKNCIGLVRKQKAQFENRWDSAAFHPSLALSEPDRLVVQCNGWVWGSVMAEKPMSKNPYFEVKILEKKSNILIGLSTKQMPLNYLVGPCKGTYAYDSLGNIWGHSYGGWFPSYELPHIDGKPRFAVGDVVGCGLNSKNGQIIYTKNGKRLDTADLLVDSPAADLFPCVSLGMPGTKIEANFGPNFRFNIAG
uniref:B30.2/SPRY domain-containing protein n=1 Tax=Globodera pallida TaxID=36090 RepID=A0A183CCJ9_GLOPA